MNCPDAIWRLKLRENQRQNIEKMNNNNRDEATGRAKIRQILYTNETFSNSDESSYELDGNAYSDDGAVEWENGNTQELDKDLGYKLDDSFIDDDSDSHDRWLQKKLRNKSIEETKEYKGDDTEPTIELSVRNKRPRDEVEDEFLPDLDLKRPWSLVEHFNEIVDDMEIDFDKPEKGDGYLYTYIDEEGDPVDCYDKPLKKIVPKEQTKEQKEEIQDLVTQLPSPKAVAWPEKDKYGIKRCNLNKKIVVKKQ